MFEVFVSFCTEKHERSRREQIVNKCVTCHPFNVEQIFTIQSFILFTLHESDHWHEHIRTWIDDFVKSIYLLFSRCDFFSFIALCHWDVLLWGDRRHTQKKNTFITTCTVNTIYKQSPYANTSFMCQSDFVVPTRQSILSMINAN